jgi:tetratricopeptide (TPR) repeat protein
LNRLWREAPTENRRRIAQYPRLIMLAVYVRLIEDVKSGLRWLDAIRREAVRQHDWEAVLWIDSVTAGFLLGKMERKALRRRLVRSIRIARKLGRAVQEAQLLLKYTGYLYENEEYEKIRTWLGRVEALLESAGAWHLYKSAYQVSLTVLEDTEGRYRDALERARSLLSAGGQRGQGEAALSVLVWLSALFNEKKAQQYQSIAVRLAETGAPNLSRGFLCDGLALSRWVRGDLTGAWRWAARAAKEHRTSGNIDDLARAYGTMVYLAAERGDWEVAKQALRRAKGVARRAHSTKLAHELLLVEWALRAGLRDRKAGGMVLKVEKLCRSDTVYFHRCVGISRLIGWHLRHGDERTARWWARELLRLLRQSGLYDGDKSVTYRFMRMIGAWELIRWLAR